MKKTNIVFNRLMIIFGVVIVLFFIFKIQESNKTEQKKQKPIQKPIAFLSANQLYHEYDSNEVLADMKYKGKIVIVSGIIQDIGKDIGNNAYIIIGGSGFLDGVQCMFQKNWQSNVARLSKNQYVKVKGKVSGKFGNVIIRKCSYRSVFRKEIE